jgi:hypothetical protein
MAGWADVRRLALTLPETSERASRERAQWRVKDKLFVWERPLRAKEVEELGALAPDGPVLGARVEHLVAKEALLADDPSVFFTTSHFNGYSAILVRLDRIDSGTLEEVVVEAWLARAPERLAREYLARSAGSDGPSFSRSAHSISCLVARPRQGLVTSETRRAPRPRRADGQRELQSGSDGTRTRDLCRDRAAL